MAAWLRAGIGTDYEWGRRDFLSWRLLSGDDGSTLYISLNTCTLNVVRFGGARAVAQALPPRECGRLWLEPHGPLTLVDWSRRINSVTWGTCCYAPDCAEPRESMSLLLTMGSHSRQHIPRLRRLLCPGPVSPPFQRRFPAPWMGLASAGLDRKLK